MSKWIFRSSAPPGSFNVDTRTAAAEKETGRLEAFSDGVFAIAMTLLVLELKVPRIAEGNGAPSSAALATALLQQWPGYVSFVTSFLTVLIMWVHHHAIFRLVRVADTPLLFTNGLLLLFVTVVPFPTAVIAMYLRTPAAVAACAFYAGTFVLLAISFYLLLMAAFRKTILLPDVSETAIQRLRKSYRMGPPLYLLSFGAAFISPWLCLGICTALWIFWSTTVICADDDREALFRKDG
ncbi:MAG: TMEM175 family protein [Bryobacteraceae bacterium]